MDHKTYLKSDQYYLDCYDRITIDLLKKYTIDPGQERSSTNTTEQLVKDVIDTFHFRLTKYERWEKRKTTVETWKKQDRALDNFVKSNPPLTGITCSKCHGEMVVGTHTLKENNTKIFYFYNCLSGQHCPKRVISPNGEELFFPRSKCPKCNAELDSKTEEAHDTLIFKDSCPVCDYLNIEKLEPPEEKPIEKKERLFYCFPNDQEIEHGKNLKEDIANMISFFEVSDEEKEVYDLDIIEKLKITDLENRLRHVLEPWGYVKFQFGTPKNASCFSVDFSAQDPTAKSEQESIRVLKRAIKKSLLKTNWRLMSSRISYRLGFLSGRLRAYETKEDLIKIAKEIADESSS